MKIGNISFNEEAIKDMSFEDFEAQFKGKLSEDIHKVYEKLTGKKPTKLENPATDDKTDKTVAKRSKK